MLTGAGIVPGDILLGLPSNGLHTNGYSLARKVLFEIGGHKPESRVSGLSQTIGEELLRVHKSYLKPITVLHDAKLLKGAAHITGGGLTDNLPRVLPSDCAVEINDRSWPGQPIFQVLKDLGNVPDDDFRRTFNLGIGMVFIVSPKKLGPVSQLLKKLREPFFEIGRVVAWRSKKQPRVAYL
jgi:phosphoribosylformylglycinamidine cyclo-ligase